MYNEGPSPEPWIILRFMLTNDANDAKIIPQVQRTLWGKAIRHSDLPLAQLVFALNIICIAPGAK